MASENDELDSTFDSTKTFLDLSTSRLTAEEAAKCLSGEFNVIIPTPSVKPCNNLDEYLHKSTLSSRKPPRDSGHHHQSSAKKSSRQSLEFTAPFAVPLVRNFERVLKKPNDPQDVQSSSGLTPASKKPKIDVFTKIEQIESNSGPLSHLKERLNQVVKVIIRRRKKVPYLSRTIEYKGTLTMFDKHMNMFLKDVIESFSYEKDGKTLKRGRHRDGLILRGDNVIMIV